MPISQDRILAGRSYRTGANELREVSAVDQDEVVYHSVFPGSAGLNAGLPRLWGRSVRPGAAGRIVPCQTGISPAGTVPSDRNPL